MSILYDGKGNQISVNGGGGSEPTPTPAPTQDVGEIIFNKVIIPNKIINMLDKSKSEKGRMQMPPSVNPNVQNSEVSDYIAVLKGCNYIAQIENKSSSIDTAKIAFYSTDKEYISITSNLETTIITINDASLFRIKFTPNKNGFIRFQYSTANLDTYHPMFFMGTEATDNFLEYSDEQIDESNFYYSINNDFRNILQRDYLQNNLYNKTVYWFGDSNSDNWASGEQRRNFEKKFGCTVRSYGTYGATWGDAENGVNSTQMIRANGQWNKFLSEVEIDSNTYLFPKDSAFFFMMGTNSGTLGEMPSNGVGAITDESCTTDISAMNYILKRVRYYGRNQPIGVFIPWECSGAKKEALIAICEYYAIPYFDITTFVPPYTHTKGLIRQDGTTVQNDYFTDGGVHLSAYGWEKFRRVAENWMAYQV